MTAKKETALRKGAAKKTKSAKLTPVFVEAEKMFDKLSEITTETASRAYDFFRERGGEFGLELDDWFKAEREILRPVTVEIRESDGNIIVSAAIPGFKPDEIEVSIKDRRLILSGQTEAREEKEKENVLFTEWRSNRFFRQVTLPATVDADKVVARLKDGILDLKMPKAEERDATKVSVAAG